MRQLRVTLETVTPLFLGGVDPRGKPELRVPSLRGALRYWLRAALGGVLGADEAGLRAIRATESAVFGSTDASSGGASVIALRLSGEASLEEVGYSRIVEYSETIERNRVLRRIGKPGIGYLLFSASSMGGQSEREGLVGTFALDMLTRPGAPNAEDAFAKAYAALWLLTHLGAVGARSRRGAGALQVTVKEGDAVAEQELPSLEIQAATPTALAKELKGGLEALRESLRQSLATTAAVSIQQPSAFDVLHPEACRIWVLDRTYDSWKAALDEIGRTFQGFRNRRRPDYGIARDAIQGNPLVAPVERAAFGLPIPFYYRSLYGAKATLEAKEHDRRASPLLMRVVKLANGRYATVLLWFQSVFLPKGDRLKLTHRGGAPLGDLPSSRLLETFLLGPDPIRRSSLRDWQLSVLEVKYV